MILECYKVLESIKQHPAMYVGDEKLNSINKYMSGYYQALLDNNIIQESLKIDPFFDWVAHKLGYHESSAGWANMILARCMGFNPQEINWEDVFSKTVTKEQHIKSVKLFYELIEQFKNEQDFKV